MNRKYREQMDLLISRCTEITAKLDEATARHRRAESEVERLKEEIAELKNEIASRPQNGPPLPPEKGTPKKSEPANVKPPRKPGPEAPEKRLKVTIKPVVSEMPKIKPSSVEERRAKRRPDSAPGSGKI